MRRSENTQLTVVATPDQVDTLKEACAHRGWDLAQAAQWAFGNGVVRARALTTWRQRPAPEPEPEEDEATPNEEPAQVLASWFAIYFKEDRVWVSGVDDDYPYDIRLTPNPWEAQRFLTAGDAADLRSRRLYKRSHIKRVTMHMEDA